MKPRQINSDCARCQQLEVRNEYLSGLIQGYDSAIAELKIEELKRILTMKKRTYPTCEVVTVYDIEQRITELEDATKNSA